jgi:hypothetical protein
MKRRRIFRRAAAAVIPLLAAGLFAPVFADAPEDIPKDIESFLDPASAYAPEQGDAEGKNPLGLFVNVPVQGFVVPAAATLPPENGNGGGGIVVPVPVPEDGDESESGESGSESGEGAPADLTDPSRVPPERAGGTWRWDEELGQWIFDEENPLGDLALMGADGNLPQTGFAGILADFPRPARLLFAVLLPLAFALLLFPRRPRSARREGERVRPRPGRRVLGALFPEPDTRLGDGD